MNSFTDFGLLTSLQKTLKDKKLFRPTEIQAQTIPLLMSGQSVVGVSETGSGKTLAYALPMLHMLKALEDDNNPVTEENQPRAVVMVPTRELGEQVSKVFKTLTHDTRLRVRPALGGMTMEQARRNTSGPFEILLATPGRLVQMIENGLINLCDVRMLVLDEADQMMDQGFLPDSNLVVGACPRDTQLALFSATVSNAVQTIMNELFQDAEVVRSKGSGKVVASLTTRNVTVVDGKRWPLLEKLLKQNVEGGTMLFANTREQCDKLAKELTDNGYECVIYRGEMDKNERRQNLKKFTSGQVDLIVATDLAGRGLDINNVGRVINYHLPKQKENYLHRAGRTARAGKPGLVVNLVTERDARLIAALDGNKPKDLANVRVEGGKVRVPAPVRPDPRLKTYPTPKAAAAKEKTPREQAPKKAYAKEETPRTKFAKASPSKNAPSKAVSSKGAPAKAALAKGASGKNANAKASAANTDAPKVKLNKDGSPKGASPAPSALPPRRNPYQVRSRKANGRARIR
jgi:ATP-dependent RNA helicase RhlE